MSTETTPSYGGHSAEEVAELLDMLALSADRHQTNSYTEIAIISRKGRDALRDALRHVEALMTALERYRDREYGL